MTAPSFLSCHSWIRRDGSIIPLDEPCGSSFREAAFACFSTEMLPSSSSSPGLVRSSSEQKQEDILRVVESSIVGQAGEERLNGRKEAEGREEEKKKEEHDKSRREQRMQVVWDPPIVKSLFVAQALYTG